MRPFLGGRVALVTGASRGLGAGTAQVLARAGAAVIATARNGDALSQVVDGITAEGAHAIAIPADLASDSDVETLVKSAVDAADQIDFLINIGGSAAAIGDNLWETSPDSWEQVVSANVIGAANLIRHVVPVMQRQHSGRLLFLSSSATLRPWPETGAYAASKAAVNQMVQTLAIELAGSGINVNAFNPGPINTPVFEHVSGVLARTRPSNAQEMAHSAVRPPHIVAQLLLWLCAPETREISGEFIQWNNPNTRMLIEQFLQSQQIGSCA